MSFAAFVFTATQLSWFGIAPDSAESLIPLACALALVGFVAVRFSAIGMAFGMAVGTVTLLLIQAIAGTDRGLTVVQPIEHWTVDLAHLVLTWVAFPVAAGVIARLLPQSLHGGAVGIALLAPPFIRYGPSDPVIDALLAPGFGNFVLLAVPWPHLIALTAAISTALFLVGPRPRLRSLALITVGLLTIAVPYGQTGVAEANAATGVAVEPASGGPLTPVTVVATFEDDHAGEPLFFWDGRRIVRDRSLMPLRAATTSRATLSFLPATTGLATAGSHEITIDLRDRQRTASFYIEPPGGLSIELDQDRHVVVRGARRGALSLFVNGPEGPELFSAQLDDSGVWRSELALPPGEFHMIVQSGNDWGELRI